jgi:4-hydroxy-tetrahydrodipicolinate synthase
MLYHSEFPEGFRTALSLRGIQTGPGRQPQSPVQQQSLVKLRDQLQCLLAAEGFTDEPTGGCSVGESIDAEEVARIVQGVVGELKKRGMA